MQGTLEEVAVSIRVGQIWERCDKRDGGRKIIILGIYNTHVRVKSWANGREFKPERSIRIDRFKPTSSGYKLFKDIE